ncbi:unnamed protein product [Trifolium pratense]|uniref:Uncharacterized protein n=1 Tax=Trifolium pratense TaxID=57577 RepID=A0ACB0M096_TRIPR|nr:unnamed protein product [Trifolium pratense]
MAKVYIFICAIIIIFSLFISITNCIERLPCEKDWDCPRDLCLLPDIPRCMHQMCGCTLPKEAIKIASKKKKTEAIKVN